MRGRSGGINVVYIRLLIVSRDLLRAGVEIDSRPAGRQLVAAAPAGNKRACLYVVLSPDRPGSVTRSIGHGHHAWTGALFGGEST
jgi:hypothetical protein